VVMPPCLAFGCSNLANFKKVFSKFLIQIKLCFFKILDPNKVMFTLASQHWKFKMDRQELYSFQTLLYI